jgi:kinesin family protein 5
MGEVKTPQKGIIPRLVESIFNGIEEAPLDIEFTVKLSYIEIYNEKVRDLLATTPGKDNLRIREGAKGVWIEDVTESYVGTNEQVLDIMNQGQSARSIAATNMNAESSRSHSVFILTLGQRNTKTESKKGSKLILVDLAGSEKIAKTGAEGKTLKEAQHINKSLSALGNDTCCGLVHLFLLDSLDAWLNR